MRRIGDNEAITISWRKVTLDFMRKLDEKVQDGRHPLTPFGESITIAGHSRTRKSKILSAPSENVLRQDIPRKNEMQRNCQLYQFL
jgi:hypothetical protein